MKNRLLAVILMCMVLSLSACGNSAPAAATGGSEAVETDKILGQDSENGIKYTLYVGLNDKDTYEQIISTEDAIDKANHIIAEHAGGYTQMSARGGWINDDGTMGHENTLVYIIYDVSEDDLKAILDELISEFNQSSVLVEKSDAAHIYYYTE